MSNWTQGDVDAIRQKQDKAKAPAKNKYNAVRVEVDGIMFDSKREAARYRELKMRQAAGEIRDLKLQPMFSVMGCCKFNDDHIEIGVYHADFSYQQLAPELKFIVEDVKSKATMTQVYRLRKKLVEVYYDTPITEV